MKNTAFEITFIPVAISIICGILITINEAAPLLPAWIIWGILIVSTIAAFLLIASVLSVGLVQWFTQLTAVKRQIIFNRS